MVLKFIGSDRICEVNLEREALLEHIIRVSRRMAEMRALDPLLLYVVDEALQLVGGERGYIVLLWPNKTLEFKAMRDKEGRDLTGGDDQISHSIVDEVTTSGRPLVVRNAMSEPRFSQAISVLNLQLRSVMCVPLISRNQVIGSLYVENRSVRGRFRKEDLSPLEIFANQAAVAIENAALNDQLQAAHQHLRKVDTMKSRFVLLVSHELRTPLAVVQTCTDLARQAAAETDSGHFSIKLEQAVDRMEKTIEEIISVFRIISGRLQLRPAPARLDHIMRSVTNELAVVSAKRQLQVRLVIPGDLPVLLLDEDQIKTALSNVIGNAVKYTPDGGTIDIEGRLENESIVVTIRDTGIGIPVEEQEHIFDIFHVLGEIEHHSTSKHAFRGGGLGLGLPIARGIVETHGGRIHMESPGYDPKTLPGTTCVISLPIKQQLAT
jgi:signal transduction histidine kinase